MRDNRNAYGQPFEEYELQVIDGDPLDVALVEAVALNQGNLALVLDRLAEWSADDKLRAAITIGECGYDFTAATDPNDFDLDLYEGFTLRDLAEHFVDGGLFGEIPERIAGYLDLDAIAHDLSFDYTETTIGGQTHARLSLWLRGP